MLIFSMVYYIATMEHGAEQMEQQFVDLKIDGRIDLILMYYCEHKYKTNYTLWENRIIEYVFSTKGALLNETLYIMVQEGLVSVIGDFEPKYRPTAKGYRINELGGWKKHIENEKRKEFLSEQQMTATIEATTLSGKAINKLESSNKIQMWMLWVTIIIATSNLGITIFKTKEYIPNNSPVIILQYTPLPKKNIHTKTPFDSTYKQAAVSPKK